MKIIDEYKNIIEDIAITKSKLTTAERELQRNMYEYRPSEIKAIDYSKDKVQSSNCQQPILVTANNIIELNNSIKILQQELQALYSQKNELEKTINNLGDINKQVMMLKIKGCTTGKIACTLNYSSRHIERLLSQIKKDVGEMSIQDVL